MTLWEALSYGAKPYQVSLSIHVCVSVCACVCTCVCIEKHILSIHPPVLGSIEHAGTGDTQDDRRRTTHEPSQGLSPRPLRCHVIVLELQVREGRP